jgi:hypothetical protein
MLYACICMNKRNVGPHVICVCAYVNWLADLRTPDLPSCQVETHALHARICTLSICIELNLGRV